MKKYNLNEAQIKWYLQQPDDVAPKRHKGDQQIIDKISMDKIIDLTSGKRVLKEFEEDQSEMVKLTPKK